MSLDVLTRDRMLRLAGVPLHDVDLRALQDDLELRLGVAEERRRPYVGQKFKHGWISVAGVPVELLTPEEADRDYGDELDRVEFDDGTAIVARSEGALTVESDGGGVTQVLAAPSPEEALGWADYIDAGLDLDEGDSTTEGDLTVVRTADGLSLRWPEGDEDSDPQDYDGVELAEGDVAGFTQGLRDMAYVTEDNAAVPDDKEDDGPQDSAMLRHRTLQLLGVEVRAFNPGQKRAPKGTETGGEWISMSARIGSLLRDWMNGGQQGSDPLAGFSQPQLKKAAEQLGLNPPKGMRLVPLKGLLMSHAQGGMSDAPTAPKVAKKAPPKKPRESVLGGPMDQYEEALHQLSPSEVKRVAEELNIPKPVGSAWPPGKDARIRYMLQSIDDAKRRHGFGSLGRFAIPDAIDRMRADMSFAPKKAAKKAVAPPVDENSQIVGGRFKHSSVGSNTIFNPNFAAAMEVDRLRVDAQPGDADNLRQILTRFKLAELKDIRARVEGAPISGRTKKEIIDDLVGLVGVKSPAGSSGTDLRPPAAGATSGKKATTPAPFDASSTAAALRETVASRADGEAMVAAMRKPELVELGRELSLPGAASMSMARLRREIVEGTVGRRLDSQATRGFKANMPGGGGAGPTDFTSRSQAAATKFRAGAERGDVDDMSDAELELAASHFRRELHQDRDRVRNREDLELVQTELEMRRQRGGAGPKG